MSDRGRAQVRGVELAWERQGGDADRPPVVWGHGLSSSRAGEDEFGLVDWTVAAPARPVVRYDARGHGESGVDGPPEAYGWDALAADQLALLDELGVDRYVAAGASMGAATALFSALAAPERVERLILVIPPTGWETRAAQVDIYETMAGIAEAGRIELLVAGVRDLAPPDPLAGDDRWVDRRIAALREADPQRLAAVFRGAATADLPAPDQLATIDAPTLILAWSGDPGHPVSTDRKSVV